MSTDRRPLSSRQRLILDVIRERLAADGYPPTLREIGAAVGLSSSSSVAHQIRVLEARGWIRTGAPGSPRAITLLDAPEDTP